MQRRSARGTSRWAAPAWRRQGHQDWKGRHTAFNVQQLHVCSLPAPEWVPLPARHCPDTLNRHRRPRVAQQELCSCYMAGALLLRHPLGVPAGGGAGARVLRRLQIRQAKPLCIRIPQHPAAVRLRLQRVGRRAGGGRLGLQAAAWIHTRCPQHARLPRAVPQHPTCSSIVVRMAQLRRHLTLSAMSARSTMSATSAQLRSGSGSCRRRLGGERVVVALHRK